MCFHIPQDAWSLWPQLLLFLKAPISGAHDDFPPFYPGCWFYCLLFLRHLWLRNWNLGYGDSTLTCE
jgi:hypothetical protein